MAIFEGEDNRALVLLDVSSREQTTNRARSPGKRVTEWSANSRFASGGERAQTNRPEKKKRREHADLPGEKGGSAVND